VLACFCIQKRVKALIIFGALSVIAALFYFYNLDVIRITGNIWDNFHERIMYFFYFVGGNLWLSSQKWISFSAGLFFFIVYIWGIFHKDYKKNLFSYACLTFLYLSAAAVAVGNSFVSISIYYRIFSSLFLVFTVLLIMSNVKVLRAYKVKYLALAFALLFNVVSMVIYTVEMQRTVENKKVSAYIWLNEKKGLVAYVRAKAAFYLEEAERLGIYKMPQYPLSEYKLAVQPDKNHHKKPFQDGISYQVESVKQEETFLIIRGWSHFKSGSMDHKDIYIYLVNEKDGSQLIYRPNFERRNDVVKDITKIKCGFFAVIDKAKIPPGTYTIEIGIKSRLNIRGDVFYVSTFQAVEI
jgi:hypothetical protein